MPTTATAHTWPWSTARCPVEAGHRPWCIPQLVRGTYELMPKGTDDVRLTILIRGGEVTTADWPQSPAQ